MIKTINNIKEMETIINENDIVIVMFGSSNCGPCRIIKEKLNLYLSENKDVIGLYVPSEKFVRYCASNSIFMVPTIVIYVKGKETIKKIRNISMLELEEDINRFKTILA